MGVRDFEGKKERCEEIGVKVLSPEESRDSTKLLEWLKSRGKSKMVVHFDLDVLDPSELIMAVGVVENGLKIAEVVNLINAINTNYDLVGLSIAKAKKYDEGAAVVLGKYFNALKEEFRVKVRKINTIKNLRSIIVVNAPTILTITKT